MSKQGERERASQAQPVQALSRPARARQTLQPQPWPEYRAGANKWQGWAAPKIGTGEQLDAAHRGRCRRGNPLAAAPARSPASPRPPAPRPPRPGPRARAAHGQMRQLRAPTRNDATSKSEQGGPLPRPPARPAGRGRNRTAISNHSKPPATPPPPAPAAAGSDLVSACQAVLT